MKILYPNRPHTLRKHPKNDFCRDIDLQDFVTNNNWSGVHFDKKTPEGFLTSDLVVMSFDTSEISLARVESILKNKRHQIYKAKGTKKKIYNVILVLSAFQNSYQLYEETLSNVQEEYPWASVHECFSTTPSCLWLVSENMNGEFTATELKEHLEDDTCEEKEEPVVELNPQQALL